MAKCAICGKTIKNIYHIHGKMYGYNCYQKELALLYKKYEDEKNAEYSAKCFAAMSIFKNKKSNKFHDSVCEQYENCKKITAKQLECIIKGFTNNEKVMFYTTWFALTNDEKVKKIITDSLTCKVKDDIESYINNDDVISILLHAYEYKRGIFFYKDLIVNKIFIEKVGVKNFYLKEYQEDDEIKVLKVVYPSKNNY